MNYLKLQFPIFQTNPNLVYLDSASSALKSQKVINKLTDYYSSYSANVHRGLYPISEKSTDEYENSREIIAKFFGVESEEIVFTSGTTESLNGLAISLERSNLIPKNPRILLTELEHHANILPWQYLKPSKLDYAPLKDYKADFDSIDFNNYDLISFALISNVTGGEVNAKNLIKRIRTESPKTIVIIDAAQAVGHKKLDFKDLDSDFVAFSGHKLYGPTGIGVLYGKKELLDKMEPFKVGGGMIDEVYRDHATWAATPTKFEAGTPAIAEAIALGEAVNFLSEVDFMELEKNENFLKNYLVENLNKIEGLKIYHPENNSSSGAVVSFSIVDIHAHDISDFLGKNNICIRAGHHCTRILHKEVLNVAATARVSLGIYNVKEDIDNLIEKLGECVRLYRK